jgi:hypothetical protein
VAGDGDFGGVALDVGFDFGQDFFDGLGFDEANVALSYGFVREDGFGARAAIASVNVVEYEGWPSREAFKVVAFLGFVEALDAEGLFDFFYVDG